MPAGTILIVDDSPVQRTAFTAVLRSMGFEVREAGTGQEGLKIAGEGQFSLILLDVLLPDLDGYEVCRRLKAAPATAAIPVILISGLGAQSKERVLGLGSGAE